EVDPGGAEGAGEPDDLGPILGGMRQESIPVAARLLARDIGGFRLGVLAGEDELQEPYRYAIHAHAHDRKELLSVPGIGRNGHPEAHGLWSPAPDDLAARRLGEERRTVERDRQLLSAGHLGLQRCDAPEARPRVDLPGYGFSPVQLLGRVEEDLYENRSARCRRRRSKDAAIDDLCGLMRAGGRTR